VTSPRQAQHHDGRASGGSRKVLVVHPEMMLAEAITSALASYPLIVPLLPATSAAEVEVRIARAGALDAAAVEERLASVGPLTDRLRRRGARVVTFGDSRPDDDGSVRVPTEAPIAALAEALVPSLMLRRPILLSAQQRRVLALVGRGLTAKEIARQLGISPKTVEQHKTRIFERLGVRNQAEAVRVAIESGSVMERWRVA
jgi:DNA-binding CsgD family transcriptional regulator